MKSPFSKLQLSHGCLCIAFTLGILVPSAAEATLIASDHFLADGSTDNYVTGNINGQVKTGGTFGYYTGTAVGSQVAGWNSGTGAFSVSSAAPGGIIHPLMANPAGTNDGRIIASGNGFTRIQYRDFVSTTPPASSDYYFSALLRKSAESLPGTTYVGVSNSRALGQNATVPTTGFFVGFSGASLSLFYNSGTGPLATKVLVAAPGVSTAYMATLHFNVSTGLLTPMVYDQTGLLVNNPALDAVTATVNTATDLGAFHFSISSEFVTGSPSVAYDELRFGTELTDVMIPEPTSAILLGGGLGLLAFARRRK